MSKPSNCELCGSALDEYACCGSADCAFPYGYHTEGNLHLQAAIRAAKAQAHKNGWLLAATGRDYSSPYAPEGESHDK